MTPRPSPVCSIPDCGLRSPHEHSVTGFGPGVAVLARQMALQCRAWWGAVPEEPGPFTRAVEDIGEAWARRRERIGR